MGTGMKNSRVVRVAFGASLVTDKNRSVDLWWRKDGTYPGRRTGTHQRSNQRQNGQHPNRKYGPPPLAKHSR